jgi:hypothetical protein
MFNLSKMIIFLIVFSLFFSCENKKNEIKEQEKRIR